MSLVPLPSDLDWMLALNEAHVTELSSLTKERLAALIDHAFYARVIRPNAAFILAFDQDAPYDSPNFLWFREHMVRFIYVDRVVVSAASRGQGFARQLYLDLFEHAKQAGHLGIACEVNADPPNPASDAFHAALGFVEVGRATLPDRGKSVRYLSRAIA